MEKYTPFLPFLFSQNDTQESNERDFLGAESMAIKRDLLNTEKEIIKRDLEALAKVPFYQAHGIQLPAVASKTPAEIEAMKKRYHEIEKELGLKTESQGLGK